MADIQINSSETELTGAMRMAIHDQVGGLAAHLGAARQLVACHVAITRPAGPGLRQPYQVRVHATVPGHELNASHHEDHNFYVALSMAFSVLRRQLHALDTRRDGARPSLAERQWDVEAGQF